MSRTFKTTYLNDEFDLDFQIIVTFSYYAGRAATLEEPEEPETLEVEDVKILLATVEGKSAYVPWAAWLAGKIDNSNIEEECYQVVKEDREYLEEMEAEILQENRRAMH